MWADPLGLFPAPSSLRQRTRACNSEEYARCEKMCGSKGVQSCRVNQMFRITRAKDGMTKFEWKDGPMSCSCNDDCDKQPFKDQRFVTRH